MNYNPEKHLDTIVVADCLFDGINANNRNAISVIDAERLTIEIRLFGSTPITPALTPESIASVKRRRVSSCSLV